MSCTVVSDHVDVGILLSVTCLLLDLRVVSLKEHPDGTQHILLDATI